MLNICIYSSLKHTDLTDNDESARTNQLLNRKKKKKVTLYIFKDEGCSQVITDRSGIPLSPNLASEFQWS